jgi:hypothetical protein
MLRTSILVFPELESELLPVILDAEVPVHSHQMPVVSTCERTHRHIDSTPFSVARVDVEFDRGRV